MHIDAPLRAETHDWTSFKICQPNFHYQKQILKKFENLILSNKINGKSIIDIIKETARVGMIQHLAHWLRL
jgi:hypothetical protein